MTFKVGDRVRCINPVHGNKPLRGLVLNDMYTIVRSWDKKGGRKNRHKQLLTVKECFGVYACSRFELVYQLPEELFEL
jgi:hypothetical protein